MYVQCTSKFVQCTVDFVTRLLCNGGSSAWGLICKEAIIVRGYYFYGGHTLYGDYFERGYTLYIFYYVRGYLWEATLYGGYLVRGYLVWRLPCMEDTLLDAIMGANLREAILWMGATLWEATLYEGNSGLCCEVTL